MQQKVLSVLSRYMSPVNAEAILSRAIAALAAPGCSGRAVAESDLCALIAVLRGHTLLFVPAPRRELMFRELDSLGPGTKSEPQPLRVVIQGQPDIVLARSLARRMCQELKASSFAVQKATTAVSELARNIVSYAKAGTIELAPAPDGRGGRRIVIRARDSGPGIPNLEEVLGGSYRSRTGLGLGLLGVKRLCEQFQVETSDHGTTVEAEVAL